MVFASFLAIPYVMDSLLDTMGLRGVPHFMYFGNINCPEEYIGESGRTFEDRLKEHLRALSPIHHQSCSTGHTVSPECFTIVDKESQGVTRNIKEVMYIHVNDTSLNRDLGKYQLPHIWDQALQDTSALQVK